MFKLRYIIPALVLVAIAICFTLLRPNSPDDPDVIYKTATPIEKSTTEAKQDSQHKPSEQQDAQGGHFHADGTFHADRVSDSKSVGDTEQMQDSIASKNQNELIADPSLLVEDPEIIRRTEKYQQIREQYFRDLKEWEQKVHNAHNAWMQSTETEPLLTSPEKYREYINNLSEEERQAKIQEIQQELENHSIASETLKTLMKQKPVLPHPSDTE